MNVKDQIQHLVRIQEIALATLAASGVVDNAPKRIEEIEGNFRERNAEYVAVKERFEALDADQKSRSSELTILEESREKYMTDLMQVQNQREYSAMLREIDTVKAHISEHEEAILKDLEEIETVKEELSSQESHIQEERKLTEEQKVKVEAEAEAARAEIERHTTDRRQIEADMPANVLATMRRLETGRAGVFLAKIHDGTCQSCYVRVRPQVFQEIRVAAKVHTCGNCRRLLYHEATLHSAGGAAGTAASDNVKALNGGSV